MYSINSINLRLFNTSNLKLCLVTDCWLIVLCKFPSLNKKLQRKLLSFMLKETASFKVI